MIIREYQTEEERDTILADMEAQGYPPPEYYGVDKLRYLEADDQAEEARRELKRTDADLAGGFEALVSLLDADGLNISARLPVDLQEKMARRAELRAVIGK